MNTYDLEAQLVDQLRSVDWSIEPDRGARLADLMRRLDAQKKALEQIAKEAGPLISEGNGGLRKEESAPAASRAVVRGPRRTMLDWCFELLGREDLHYEEITRRMLAGGYVTRGKTPERSVVAELGRHPDKFEPLGGGYYRLRREAS
jgi:hypothetical protein